MRGDVEKKGRGLTAGWQMRTFELNESTAELASKDPKKGDDEMKAVGRVLGARTASAVGVRKHCFAIEFAAGGRPPLQCSVQTAEERTQWLEALQRAGGNASATADHHRAAAPAPLAPHSQQQLASFGPKKSSMALLAGRKSSGAALRDQAAPDDATLGAGLDRARDMKDKMQAIVDRFGSALEMLEAVLAAGSKLPVFGSVCEFLRKCAGLLGTMKDVSQDVLDFAEMLIEAAEHLRHIAGIAHRLEDAAATQLNRLLEAVRDLVANGSEALSKFGQRGWFMAMIKAAGSLKTLGKLAEKMKDKFQQIHTTIMTAQLRLSLDERDRLKLEMTQKPFAAEQAVARQVQAILAQQGGDAGVPADVAKATDSLAEDERALQAIKAEAGLSEEIFRSEMELLHEGLGAIAEQQQHIASGVDQILNKKKSVQTKEDALEHNRIDPAAVQRSGQVIGKGAHGEVTKVSVLVVVVFFVLLLLLLLLLALCGLCN